MTITVSGQKPVTLDPLYTDDLTKDFDPGELIENSITQVIQQPLRPGQTPAFDENGQDLAPQLQQLIITGLDTTVSPQDQQRFRELMRQCLIRYDVSPSLPIGELFANQAASMHKLPAPSSSVHYTAGTDIIPTAKVLLNGSDPEAFFASIAYTYHPQTLGVWFQDADAFARFQTWVDQQSQAIHAAHPLDAAVLNLIQQFGTLDLKGLTESLLLRKQPSDAQQPGSFPRLLVHLVMSYIQSQSATNGAQTAGLMPFTMSELFCPTSIVFANVEAHSRATPNRVHRAWDDINKSLALPIKMVSHHKLSKLTALHRSLSKAAAVPAISGQGGYGRSSQVVFRKKPPTSIDLLTSLKRVLRRMGQVSSSQNIYKRQVRSFTRASRRDPTGLNSPGLSTRVAYLPDLHIYLDTSGSISEENYQDAIMMLIRLAKKMNVNLYFNSFSDILSQPALLKTRGKSTTAIYREFTKIPKVTGGTDYEQIWRYIEASRKRKKELSLIITDFEWYPRSTYAGHPKNLYYAPISNSNWNYLKIAAKNYVQSMAHIEPALARRMIGLYC